MQVVEVKSDRQYSEFVNFPHKLYRTDSHYVPALQASIKWLLSKKNPFLEHSEIAAFLALENEEVVGRIVAIYNQTHLDTYSDQTGFFGFFDTIDNSEIAVALFQACEQWLSKKGIRKIVGPTNLTTNDSCGVLVEGFDLDPMISMPFNYQYYNDIILKCGFQKSIDLNSYSMDGSLILSKFGQIYERGKSTMNTLGINIRCMSKSTFPSDIEKLHPVYNAVNSANWGFMPLNLNEFKAMATDLKRSTPLDMALVVEKNNEIIGFMITVPNLNEALKKVSNGRLFPFGILKLMYYRRHIKTARIMILGILDQYKGLGIDLVLYQTMKEAVNKHNIIETEACYVMETNRIMNSILKKISKGIIKKYRIYEKEISV